MAKWLEVCFINKGVVAWPGGRYVRAPCLKRTLSMWRMGLVGPLAFLSMIDSEAFEIVFTAVASGATDGREDVLAQPVAARVPAGCQWVAGLRPSAWTSNIELR
jgi:hypothetical protein